MLQLTYTFTVHPGADFAKLGAALAALHAVAAGPVANSKPAPVAAAPVAAAPVAATPAPAPVAPAAAPKRGRGRPPKPKLVETEPAVPDAVAPSVPATVTVTNEPAKVLTLDDLKLAMRKFLERDKIERCKELFAKHGFTKLHEIPADKFGVLIAELNNALPPAK